MKDELTEEQLLRLAFIYYNNYSRGLGNHYNYEREALLEVDLELVLRKFIRYSSTPVYQTGSSESLLVKRRYHLRTTLKAYYYMREGPIDRPLVARLCTDFKQLRYSFRAAAYFLTKEQLPEFLIHPDRRIREAAIAQYKLLEKHTEIFRRPHETD